MPRYMEIILERRNIRCLARLLDDEAPKTSEIVWRALPLQGPVYHAKYANHEIYTIISPFAEQPGPENRTITPIPGDVMYFYLPPGTKLPAEAKEAAIGGQGVVDLALFYDRNNLLLSPAEGFTPGNVFAVVEKNLEAMREAGHSVWMEGAIGERLVYRCAEGTELLKWGMDSSQAREGRGL